MRLRMRYLTILAPAMLATLAVRAADPVAVPARQPAVQVMGYRGDNQGHFVGKNFPTKWSNTENLAWNTEMPGWGLSQPIVVGDLVITTAEPDLVVAVDAKTGKIRWQRAFNPFLVSGAMTDEKRAVEALNILRRAALMYMNPGTRGGWDDARFAQWHAQYYLPTRWAERKCRLITEAAAVFPEFGITAMDPDEANARIRAAVEAKDRKAIEAVIVGVDREYRKVFSGVFNRWRFFSANVWPEHISWTMPTPVTDGTRIFVSMGQGQVACLDQNGEVLWQRFMPADPRGHIFNSGHEGVVPSPILADGKLVVPIRSILQAFDPDTGETLWRIDYSSAGTVFKPCSTGAVLTLDGTPVWISGQPAVFRLRDGKLLGSKFTDKDGKVITCVNAERGGTSMLTDGKDTVFVLSGNNGFVIVHALRLRMDGPDKVVGDVVWSSARTKPMNPTPLLYDGFIYQGNLVRDTKQDGAMIKELPFKSRVNYFVETASMSAADGVTFATGYPSVRELVAKPKSGHGLYATLIRMAGAESSVIGENIITGLPFPRTPWMDDYRAAYGAEEGDVSGGRIYWSPEGARLIPAYPTIGAPAIAGDRIYYRTCGALLCIAAPAKEPAAEARQ